MYIVVNLVLTGIATWVQRKYVGERSRSRSRWSARTVAAAEAGFGGGAPLRHPTAVA